MAWVAGVGYDEVAAGLRHLRHDQRLPLRPERLDDVGCRARGFNRPSPGTHFSFKAGTKSVPERVLTSKSACNIGCAPLSA